MTLTRFLYAMAILLLAGCASRRTTAPDASVPATLQALARQHRVCGAVLAVIRQRKLESLTPASGCPAEAAVHPGSVFQAASLSKPVFAYAVLRLSQQGKLDLDQPLMRYLPQGYYHHARVLQDGPARLASDPQLHRITARMILNHTSGLPNWSRGPLTTRFSPGTRWEYSGEGYVLLQRVVERVTGMPLDRFMRSLDMPGSDFVWNAQLASKLLPGRKANGGARQAFEMRRPVAAFSLYTTAADYGNFLVKVLNDSALLQQTLANPVAVDGRLGISWGLGWGIEHDGLDRYLWQWGSNPGYRAFAIASVASGDGFVLLTNSENGLALAQPLARKLLPGERTLFQSPLLGTDVVTQLCTWTGVCL